MSTITLNVFASPSANNSSISLRTFPPILKTFQPWIEPPFFLRSRDGLWKIRLHDLPTTAFAWTLSKIHKATKNIHSFSFSAQLSHNEDYSSIDFIAILVKWTRTYFLRAVILKPRPRYTDSSNVTFCSHCLQTTMFAMALNKLTNSMIL